jgi:lysophospholipase L1-like esterase
MICVRKVANMMPLVLMVVVHYQCTKAIEQVKTEQLAEQSSLARIAAITSANGDLNDTNIKYFGRWDFSNTSKYVSKWGGAYIKVRFTGTTVKIMLGNKSNYYAKIDDGPWVSYKGVTGTVNLTPTPLAGGTHTLSVAQGKDNDYIFTFLGLVLDPGATTLAPPVGIDLIEWIGDSITAGYTDSQANVSDYAWVCSEAMDTEHTQIAYPGICLVSGYTTNPGMDAGYFKLQSPNNTSSPPWDFSRYTAKLVVINLGTNDYRKSVPTSTFQNTMTTFLNNVRAKFPKAEIFVMQTFKYTSMAAPIMAAVKARQAAGDGRVIYIPTTNWLTSADYNPDGLHPSDAGNIKIANLLTPILSPYLSSATPFYLDHCDATTGWSTFNVLSVNTTDKKEGSGSLQSTGSSSTEFRKVFTTPVHTGASAVTGSIQFWYYVSDVTKLSSSNQIEIGSGGMQDVKEYNWKIGTLTNGWNLITKPISAAAITNGTPDLNAINWIRIYHSKTGSITTRIDGFRIIP